LHLLRKFWAAGAVAARIRTEHGKYPRQESAFQASGWRTPRASRKYEEEK
jgi:hypothetical protein